MVAAVDERRYFYTQGEEPEGDESVMCFFTTSRTEKVSEKSLKRQPGFTSLPPLAQEPRSLEWTASDKYSPGMRKLLGEEDSSEMQKPLRKGGLSCFLCCCGKK